MARKQAATKEPTLKELRTRRTFLQESLAVKQLEATTRLVESFGFYDDFPSDDLWERTRGRRFQAFPPSQPSDRKGGANWPLWRTEAELDLLRQRSRVLSKVNGYAVCLLRNLTNYVIGDGFKYKAQAKAGIDTNSTEPGQQVSEDIERTVVVTQSFIDQHNERNRWNCAGNPLETQPTANTREREAFRRVIRDGECFIRLFHGEDGATSIRFIEPELVRNPAGKNASASGWTYGIQHYIDPETGIEDVERIVAYNVRYPDSNEEVIDAAEVIHIRADDEDCTIKRGTPAFSYDTASALERASKLQRNTSTAAAIRAATAEIWEYETATQAQLTALATSLSSAQVNNPTTGRLENIEDIRPGTIRRVPQGQKKVPLDSASGVTEHLAAVQGDLRQAGAAFAAPEYITGDASNANYSSTKEAGTPFVLNGESTQAHFKSAFLTVLWRCIKHAVDCGRLPGNALRVVELQVEAPAIKQRDPLQKAQEDQILSPLGKSNQTILMENGLDPEVEANNKQEWQDRFGAPGMGLDMPPDLPPIPGMESRETQRQWLARLLREAKDEALKEWRDFDETKVKRDHGKFAKSAGAKAEKKPKGKAAKDADPAPAKPAGKPKTREALNDTIATAKADPSPENLAALAEHFNTFGRRELMAIKKEMGIRATDRKKADTVKQLVEAATKRLTDRQIAERDAKAAGIPIKAMVQTAKEMRQNANSHVNRIAAAIKEAKATYAHYNKAPLHRGRKELKAIFKDGDYDKIPHWDEIAKSVAAAFPDLKIDEGYLFDLIAGGPPRKLSYQDSYKEAIDVLHHRKQTAAADVPF